MAAERIPLPQVADLLAPGRPLPFRVLDDAGRLLLAQGQVIVDARQLQSLIERGACVEYAEVQSTRNARAAASGTAGMAAVARTLTWFDHREQQIGALDALLRSIGREPDVAPRLQTFAHELIALLERQSEAALFVTVRQDEHRFALYSITHALNTATVALMAARQLAWPDARVNGAVLAALTMNAAIVDLQGRMAEQKEPPSKAQLGQIRAHPQRAAELLQAGGVTDAECLQAVLEHHERAGGTGYPRGSSQPCEMARLLRAADVFTAKISPRVLRAPLLPQMAARQLFQEEGGGPIAAALIKAVGVYPPGDFVRLKNGEIAIVVQRSGSGSAPIVAVLVNARGKPISGAPRRDTALAENAIAGPLLERAGLARVLPEAVYGLLM